MRIIKKGILFVISGPSGVGKTSIYNKVMDMDNNIYFSVSCTTRAPRLNEVEGKSYFFLKEEQFLEDIEKNKFLEWAKVHDHYYGTLQEEVLSKIDAGKDVLLDIDVQGARSVRAKYKEAVLIFIAPPSIEELKNRIVERKTETETQVAKRLAVAEKELSCMDFYDYIIYNNKLDKAVDDLINIIKTERAKNIKKET